MRTSVINKVAEIAALYKQGFDDAVVLEADLLVQQLIIALCEHAGCSIEIAENERSQERAVLTTRLSVQGIHLGENVHNLRRLRNELEHPESKSEAAVENAQTRAAAKTAISAVNEVITLVNAVGFNN
jgi:hypothetical protein